MVKIFTMVKDEVDVIKDWIIYHGSLFGWTNIYIIDNYSTDGTYEIIQECESLGINIFRETDYKKKGEYMTLLIKKFASNERFAFPIDIDEFIVYCEPNSKQVIFDKKLINDYFDGLPISGLYKANYLIPVLTNPYGSNRAPAEVDYALYVDYDSHAKSFINPCKFKEEIDHGNHIPSYDYFFTNIVLIHFHERNVNQIKKKSLNNVTGFGYSTDINYLKKLIESNPVCDGNHHIKKLIDMHENKYQFPYTKNPDPEKFVSVKPFKQRILDGFF